MRPFKNIPCVFGIVTFVDVLTAPGLKLLCMGFFFCPSQFEEAIKGIYLCLQQHYPHQPGLYKLHQLLKRRQKQCINDHYQVDFRSMHQLEWQKLS